MSIFNQKDRDETKKFLYDTALDTTHMVLDDDFDEQMRAVLNYSPVLNVRVFDGINVCPAGTVPKTKEQFMGTAVVEPPKPKPKVNRAITWIGTLFGVMGEVSMSSTHPEFDKIISKTVTLPDGRTFYMTFSDDTIEDPEGVLVEIDNSKGKITEIYIATDLSANGNDRIVLELDNFNDDGDGIIEARFKYNTNDYDNFPWS